MNISHSSNSPSSSSLANATNPATNTLHHSIGASVNDEISTPIYSQWFSFDAIHDIEKRALPEFFSDSGNPERTVERYKELRDFMINTYRIRPNEYLSVTTCRRHLKGDVGTIIRIHAFLEQWGLINSYLLKTGMTDEANASFTSTLQGKLPINPSQSSQSSLSSNFTSNNANSPLSSPSFSHFGLDSRVPNIEMLGNEALSIKCQTCNKECNNNYFSAIRRDFEGQFFIVCSDCYGDGRYPPEYSTGDFLKYNPIPMGTALSSLSEKDSSTLLSLIEDHTGANGIVDWDIVSQKMGKPKDQCIWYFLRLPIIESLESKNVKFNSIPSGNIENPIMSTVAFLSSLVHPKVAAAAAQAALSELIKQENESLNNEKNKEKDENREMETETEMGKFADKNEQIIAGTAVACAAVRAKQLLDEEVTRYQKLHDLLIDLQLQKLRLKVSIYEELEKGLDSEIKDLNNQRLALFVERLSLRKRLAEELGKNNKTPVNGGIGKGETLTPSTPNDISSTFIAPSTTTSANNSNINVNNTNLSNAGIKK